MLYKFKRHKTRRGFPLDKIFKGLSVNKFSHAGRHVFVTHKYLSPYFGDERFCNMLVQWEEQIGGKYKSIKAKRLFPFYPSYIPFKTHKTIVSKSDYYKIINGIDYSCINCGSEIRPNWGSRHIRNFICSRCTSLHFLTKADHFRYGSGIKELYGDRFSKNIIEFFKLEQDKEHKMLHKILTRQKNYLMDTNLNDRRKISGIFTKIKNNLPS